MEFRALIELVIPVLLTGLASELTLQQKQSRLVNKVPIVIDIIAIIFNGRNLLAVLSAIKNYNAWNILAICFLLLTLGTVALQIMTIIQYSKNKKAILNKKKHEEKD